MREVLEFFLDDQGTKYQLHAEMREAGIVFRLSVRNELGQLFASGEASERDGDLESYEDGDGEAHPVSLYRYRSPECKLWIGIALDDAKYAWVVRSECDEEKEGLRFVADLPLGRVRG